MFFVLSNMYRRTHIYSKKYCIFTKSTSRKWKNFLSYQIQYHIQNTCICQNQLFFTILTATNKEFSSVGSLLPTYFQKCFSMYMLIDFPWVNNYLVLNNFLQILLIFCYQYSLMLQQGDLAVSLRNPLDFHN